MDEYCYIETHILFSKKLYELDQKSRYVLKELERTKNVGIRRSGKYIFGDDISLIYDNIINCTSLKRLRSYFCLQYFLDELMYYQIQKLSDFYIEDNKYNISKMYFEQKDWITDMIFQKYKFLDRIDLDINEVMFLVCYLKEYDGFLIDIEEYIKLFKENKYIINKLKKTIYNIRIKHNRIWKLLISIINNNLKKN